MSTFSIAPLQTSRARADSKLSLLSYSPLAKYHEELKLTIEGHVIADQAADIKRHRSRTQSLQMEVEEDRIRVVALQQRIDEFERELMRDRVSEEVVLAGLEGKIRNYMKGVDGKRRERHDGSGTLSQ